MEESWKQFAKGKKTEAKGHILYDSIYMKCPEQAKLQRPQADQGLPTERGSGK